MADSCRITMDVSGLQKPVSLRQVTPLVSCKLTASETYRLANSGGISKEDDGVDDLDLSSVNVHHRLYDSCAGDDVNDNFEFDEYDDEYATDVHFDPPPRYAAERNMPKDNGVLTSAQNGTFTANHVEEKCSDVAKSVAEDYCDNIAACDRLPAEPPFGYPPCADRLMSSAIGLLEDSNMCQHRLVSPPALPDVNDASSTNCANGINGGTLFDENSKHVEAHDQHDGDGSFYNYISAALRGPPTTGSAEVRQSSLPRRRPNKHSSTRTCSIPKSDSVAENASYNIDEAVRFINGDTSGENAQDSRRTKSLATKVGKSSSKSKTKQHVTSSGDDGPGPASSIGSPEDSAESLPSPDEKPQADSSHKSKSVSAIMTVENDVTKEEHHILSSDHISSLASADSLNATLQMTDGEFTDVVRRKRKDVVGQRKQLRPASNHCMLEQPKGIHRAGNGSFHEIEQHILEKSMPISSGPDRKITGTGDASLGICSDPDHLAAFPALPSRPLRRNSTGNLPAVPETNNLGHSGLVELAERPTAFQKPFASSYASIVVARLPKTDANNCKPCSDNSSKESKPADEEQKRADSSSILVPNSVTVETSGISNEFGKSTSAINAAVENDRTLSVTEVGLHSGCVDDTVTMDAGVDLIPSVAVVLSDAPPLAVDLQIDTDDLVPSSQDQPVPDSAVSSDVPQSSSCVPQVHTDQLASSTSHYPTSPQPTSTSKNVPRPSHPAGSDDAIVFLDTRSKTDRSRLSNSWGISFWYDDKNDSVPTEPFRPPSDATADGTEQPVTLDFLQLSAVDTASSETTATTNNTDDRMQTRGSFDVRTAQRFLLNVIEPTKNANKGCSGPSRIAVAVDDCGTINQFNPECWCRCPYEIWH